MLYGELKNFTWGELKTLQWGDVALDKYELIAKAETVPFNYPMMSKRNFALFALNWIIVQPKRKLSFQNRN